MVAAARDASARPTGGGRRRCPIRTPDGGFERASSLGHVPTVAPPARPGDARPLPDAGRARQGRRGDRRQPDRPARRSTQSDQSRSAGRSRPTPARSSTEVDPHFPSTRVLFMQMAAVIVDLQKLRDARGAVRRPCRHPRGAAGRGHGWRAAFVEPHAQRRHASAARVPRGGRHAVPSQHGRGPQPARRPARGRGRARRRRPRPPGTLVMHRCPNCECGRPRRSGQAIRAGRRRRRAVPGVRRAADGHRRATRPRDVQRARLQPGGLRRA